MSLTSAAAIGTVLSFFIFVTMAGWYAAPWLRARPRADALTALLWVHAFRYVALQIFSAQKFGFAASDQTRNLIAAGDLIGMLMAIAAIVLLRYRVRAADVVVWAFVAETVVDLIYGTIAGAREQLYESASNVTWLILVFYVPLLWVSLGLMIWLLLRRGGEAVSLVRAG